MTQRASPDRKSAKGKPRLSNLTDNESAKMATDKGVIQGYAGVVAVDETNQIIMAAPGPMERVRCKSC